MTRWRKGWSIPAASTLFSDDRFGPLAYRRVRFETERLEMPNYQGNAVVNYTDAQTPYTRIIEHKHFTFGTQPYTIISREYSAEWKPGEEPYVLPSNAAKKNQRLYQRYQALADKRPNVTLLRPTGPVPLRRHGRCHGGSPAAQPMNW